MTNETTTAPAAVVPSVSTVDLTLSDDPLDDACAGDKTPAARLRAAAAALRDRERSARDLDEHCEHPFRCSTILPLAALLENAAARWERDVLLDRPESPEMTPANPLAWWCGTCEGAIASRDYSDAERCLCGWWTESIALAEAVLAAAAVSE